MIPTSMLRNWVRPVYRAIRLFGLRGHQFSCPLCGGRFKRLLPKGDPVRQNAMCPACGSLERHRLLWLFLSQERAGAELLHGKKRLLHIAPEPALAQRLRALPGCEYLSADRESGRADQAFDLTNIPFGENRFDFILCCHVLEHIPEDVKALREMHRILAPGGVLVVQVPLGNGPTQEDATVIDPGERCRRFGQEDHVRLYGLDLVDRMQGVGFSVTLEKPYSQISKEQCQSMRLAPDGEEGEPVFVARKFGSIGSEAFGRLFSQGQDPETLEVQ